MQPMDLNQIRFKEHDSCEALTQSILAIPEQTRREKRLQLQPNQLLWLAGDPPRHVYRLESGRVEVTEANKMGRVTAVQIIQPGQIFGYLCFCDHRAEPTGSEAKTVIRSVVHRTGFEDFRKALKTDEKAASMLTVALCDRVAFAERRNRVLAIHNARTRLSTLLHQLATTKLAEGEQNASTVLLHLSHAHLASHASLTRPHTTVLMTRLRSLGCVSYHRGSAIKVDLKKLRRLLTQEE